VLVIARPLRQIGRRILSLGRSDLGEPITVKGARDLELLGQRLEWLRLRLLELEEQKAQFLRNVSHELKTPLTNIREGAELLSEDSANGVAGEYRQVARIVRDNSLRLQQMIEELLRYGSEGDITADQESQLLQFDQLVLAVMERHALTAKAHAVEMIPRLESVELEGNAKRLQVIVENLLSNALKYAPRGGYIMVELAAGPEDVKLDVRDNGPGIPESDRERIFEWFYTGARPPGSIVAGTGFGLAIAQQYAGQHDGQITLLPSSEGAHFQLTIRKRIA
jgi:two-component system sensor histidine kinase GlrK